MIARSQRHKVKEEMIARSQRRKTRHTRI